MRPADHHSRAKSLGSRRGRGGRGLLDGGGNEHRPAPLRDDLRIHIRSQPDDFQIARPQQTTRERRRLSVGERADREVERVATAGERWNDSPDFDGGYLVGGEKLFRVQFFRAVVVVAQPGAIELLRENRADFRAHVTRARAGQIGDDPPALNRKRRSHPRTRHIRRSFRAGRDRPAP